MSMKLTPTAVLRVRTSPGPGSGSSTSSHRRTSGPPFSCMRMARVFIGMALSRSTLEVRAQEVARAAVSELGRPGVVVLAADAGEAVVGIGIDVQGDVGVLRQRGLDLLLRLRRHVLVATGDVHEQRLED